ncbi:hypothetical protein [Flavobacterium franklandianum]|uniref:hypothetical protein n=1 Tax=Flavobacterium franklandianum TaxID=2594430 RepID=UPI00163DB7BC|nr:hypothetical protein [Flavobacterium franklandianum]
MQAAHRVAKNTRVLYARMAITMFISLYTTVLVLADLPKDIMQSDLKLMQKD